MSSDTCGLADSRRIGAKIVRKSRGFLKLWTSCRIRISRPDSPCRYVTLLCTFRFSVNLQLSFRRLTQSARLVVLTSAFVLGVATVAGQQPTESSSAAALSPAPSSPPSSAKMASVSIPSYPDNTKGLQNLVKDMLKLEKEGDQQQLVLYEKSLALPDPDDWFKSVFGEDLGARMTVASAALRAAAKIHTADMLAAQLAEKQTDVEAVRFDDSCNLRATATEYPFLLLRQKPEHLYDVRFLGTSNVSLWTYFAYVDGGFRYVGNFKKTELGVREAQRPPDPDVRIRVGGTVAAAKLIHQVVPVYPQEAKSLGMQGAVILHAIIGKDGSIQDLYLNEGQCLLTQSAMDAVRKWKYSPTTLNGNPVEVDTTIQVIYTLQ